MKDVLGKKLIGFYFVALAGVITIISLIYFLAWAPKHNAMNPIILVALIVALILNLTLIVYDSDYLLIASTACYSIALFQFLSDSVGSFVDKFQGIVMFGDSTQVGTIISISCLIAISILASILASFMRRVKTDI